jgi:hypothetical protein
VRKDKDSREGRNLFLSLFFFLFWMMAYEDVMAGTQAAILSVR